MTTKTGQFLYCFLLFHCLNQTQAQEFAQMDEIKLSKPIAHYSSTLFEDSIALHFSPTYSESIIHYTTDGSEPTEKSPIFADTKHLKNSTLLKAVAFHPHLQSSPTISINFVQASKLKGVKKLTLLTQSNEKYKGSGGESLIDFQKGTLNFREATWMGFDQQKMEIVLEFEKRRKVKKVVVSALLNHGAWIFLPEKIEVRTKKASFVLDWKMPTLEEVERLEYLTVPLEGVKTKCLHITIQNAKAIPDWHSGAGKKPWLFIDEVIIE